MFDVTRTAEFAQWLARLVDPVARAAILVRLDRLALGNVGDARPVGEGVSAAASEREGCCEIEKSEETEMTTRARKIDPRAARKLGVRRFDAADHLLDERDIAAYLQAALAEDDPRVLTAALGAIARARGMTQLARDTGLSREALYRSLSEGGNPEIGTVSKVLRAFGMRLSVEPASVG